MKIINFLKQHLTKILIGLLLISYINNCKKSSTIKKINKEHNSLINLKDSIIYNNFKIINNLERDYILKLDSLDDWCTLQDRQKQTYEIQKIIKSFKNEKSTNSLK
jgi:hypothetical protein